MPEFLAELYVPKGDEDKVSALALRAKATAARAESDGLGARYVRSIFVPVDEICFFVFEAASADAVAEIARRAELPLNRISEARADP